ncbi:unnamed protein product [Ceutorhynchus assimilis]|uniref:Ionotropic receptor n=1 Tax=Ceutorhynchus assimilis TaxID=467358 RepID=A0A9N9QC29_9CUCU|nr:unnamed protein product [Ceutorhynchus assimilis]
MTTKFYKLNAAKLNIPSIIKIRKMPEHLKHKEIIETNLKNYSVIRVMKSTTLSKKDHKKNRFYNSISFEPHLVQVVIIENPITLYKFLKSTPKQLFKYTRGLNIILFSSINVEIEDIQKFLIFYWEEYQRLNVIVQAPFCCKLNTSWVIFKPFEPTQFGFGQIQIHDLEHMLQTNMNLLQNHAARLNGYPLRISLFERYPTALTSLPKLLEDSKIYKPFSNSPGLFGVDGMSMRYLSKIMNFEINLCTDSECQYFGVVFSSNRSVIGSLNKILERTIDIQGNGWFIMDYGIKNLEFTLPYDFDELCIVTLKAPKKPVWLKMLFLFKEDAGIAIIVTILLLTVINRQHSLIDSAMEMYCILIGQPSLCAIKKNQLWKRILIGSASIFSLIITTVFTSTLFMALQTVTYFPNMQTLEEVDNSNVKMISSFDPFAKSPLKLYERLSKKFMLDPKLTDILKCVVQGLGAGVERYTDGQLRIATEYLSPDGSPLLHIVPDCPKKMFLGYLTPMGSPYLEVINYYLRKFGEAGLFIKWHQDFIYAIKLVVQTHHHNKHGKIRVLDLNDVYVAFCILIYGLLGSFFVFLVEILKGQYDTRRQRLKNQGRRKFICNIFRLNNKGVYK